jgi:hypothetical protein
MKTILSLIILAISISKVTAQTNSNTQLAVILECAKPDNTIDIQTIANCKKLKVTGQDSENFKVRAGLVVFNLNGTLTQNPFGGENLSDVALENFKKLKPGAKIFIENIIILDLKTKETRKVPDLKFILK